jgi:hypothetical protein
MNTLYQLRDEITDENIGLYTFKNVENYENVISLYTEYKKERKEENFDEYLMNNNIDFTRLFVEEIYV